MLKNIEGRTGGVINKSKGKIFRNADDIEIISSVSPDNIKSDIVIKPKELTELQKNAMANLANNEDRKTTEELKYEEKIKSLKEELVGSKNIDVDNLDVQTGREFVQTGRDLSKLPKTITGLEAVSGTEIIDEYYPGDEDANAEKEDEQKSHGLSKIIDVAQDIYENNQTTKYTHLLTSAIDEAIGSSTLFNNAKLRYVHIINKGKFNEIFFDETKNKYFYRNPQPKKEVKSKEKENENNNEKNKNNTNAKANNKQTSTSNIANNTEVAANNEAIEKSIKNSGNNNNKTQTFKDPYDYIVNHKYINSNYRDYIGYYIDDMIELEKINKKLENFEMLEEEFKTDKINTIDINDINPHNMA